MPTTPQLLERFTGVVELGMPTKSSVATYQVGAALSLNTAFAGTTNVFSVPNGGYFRSRTLRRNRINRTDEVSRGWTRASVNFDDFASPTVPGDVSLSFLRVTEVDLAGASGPEGPILVVPPPGFFSSSRKVLVLEGTSPNVSSTVSGLPPAGCMQVVLPRFSDRVEFFNQGLADILLSFDAGTPEFTVSGGDSLRFEQSGVKELFIHSDGATADFSVILSMVDGISH